jgi:hypothetical protein
MAAEKPVDREASLLMAATMVVSIVGILLGIVLLFVNTDVAVRVAAAILVGCVGIISFFRHSIYGRSDQVRMGWRQDYPEFKMEVGFANLAVGFWAIVAAIFNWGPLVCGLVLLIYATYLLCALFIHLSEARAWEDLHIPAHRQRAVLSIVSTGIFVLVLLVFGGIAVARSGIIPFLSV